MSVVFTVRVSLQFTKIKQVNDIMPNNMVDVMGIVDRVEPSAIIQTRDSREVSPLALLLPMTTQEIAYTPVFIEVSLGVVLLKHGAGCYCSS